MSDDKPLPGSAFLARSAAFARSLGAAPGVYAVVLSGERASIPIIGSVNGPTETLKASKDARLQRALAVLAAAERRTRLR